MVGALAALQGQVAAVEQQLQQTQAQMAANGGQHNGPRLPKPPYFTGKTKDTSVVNWAHQMETFMAASAMNLNGAHAALYAAGYLTDSALTWYRLHLQSVQQGRAAAFNSWYEMKAELVRCFQPISPERAARDRLNTLFQGKSVRQYAETFSQCILEIPDMAEGDRVSRFLQGLKPKVRLHVEIQQPATLARAIELATQVDSLMWQIDNKGARSRATRSFYESDYASDSAPSHSEDRANLAQNSNGPTPMQICAAEMKPSSTGDKDRTYYTNMRCYNCNELGHPQKLCPHKKTTAGDRRGRDRRNRT